MLIISLFDAEEVLIINHHVWMIIISSLYLLCYVGCFYIFPIFNGYFFYLGNHLFLKERQKIHFLQEETWSPMLYDEILPFVMAGQY